MKRLIALVAALLLIPQIAVANDVVGEQFVIAPPAYSDPAIGVVIEDSQFIKNQITIMQSWGPRQFGETMAVTDLVACKSYGSINCGDSDMMFYKTSFGYCTPALVADCVANVKIKDSKGIEHSGEFVREFPGEQKYLYSGNQAANLPAGGSNFLMRFKDAPHSKGDLYLIAANINGDKQPGQSKFYITDFRVGIFAVTILQGNYGIPHPIWDSGQTNLTTTVGIHSFSRLPNDFSTGKSAPCAQVSKTECAIAWPLPLDYSFSLSLKLQTKITGWIHGRISEINADLSSDSSGLSTLQVEGKPVVVPTVFTWFKNSEVPASVRDFYANDPRRDTSGTGFGGRAWSPSQILKDYIGYTENYFKEAMAWFDAIGDKSPIAATQWSFRSIEGGSLDQRCYKDTSSILGLVTTNSTMFIANPPTFNKADQTLDYKVSSPHFLPDGSVFKGIYNLVMRSEFARCLYGYSQAPVSATVSILSSDGTNQVATTTLAEKNGWLYLSANGFTFSSPTLKVKLVQQKPAGVIKPTDGVKPAPAPAKLAKKVTISCVKGKNVKKVTAINPKCPAGYKKK